MKSTAEKFQNIIDNNTFYFFDHDFEEKYESHINSIRETLLVLKNEIDIHGLKKDIFEQLLAKNSNGLTALLTLTGFSNESFKRLVTFIRIADNPELAGLVYKVQWNTDKNPKKLTEWSDKKIEAMLRDNEFFRKGIVNIFFEGATTSFLAEKMRLFELKKLSISKLQFDISAMIDTLIRYKVKGSSSGKKENNPEKLIANLLTSLGLTSEKGDLSELVANASDTKRTMDFIIPDKNNPRIIVESSFLVTTSSGQGDKSKTEISVQSLIQQYYPQAKFIGFIDGIGWYVRKNDLKRMVAAYEDVFTFHRDELARFEKMLRTEFNIHA
jgi:hypothetical protein